jgi:sulfite reductase alpha subunit-like flavoprotein
VVAQHGTLDLDATKAYVRELSTTKRYQRDVY